MKKGYEITLGKFYSECKQYYDVSNDVAIEDIRFIKFTDLLDASGIFRNPKHCRYEGLGINNAKWSILGYSFANDIVSYDDEDDENEDNSVTQRGYEWNYTFFNGVLSGETSIINSKKSDIQKSVSETVKFIEATFSGNPKFLVQDYHPIRELQDHILSLNKKNQLDRISICIVTDNIIEHDNLETTIYIESLQRDCKIHYWGINKWSDLSKSKSKRLPINIDFVQDKKMNYDVSFLEQKGNNDDVKYCLSIFPGDLIADLYNEFDTQLLENNVRVFLSLKSKYNREMSKTISSAPDMFFSYNNGISATASSIKVNKHTHKIESIYDFQIVNGGQTTATLYHTKKKLKKSLADIYVQVKITVLRNTKNNPDIIKNISKYANSQTAVKPSDFWTNDAYLLDFEKICLRNHIFLNGSFVYYFFERMTGQYKETSARQGTDREISAWEKQNPKKLSFNKIDLGRWFNALGLHPYVSVQSATAQFETFMNSENKPLLTDSRCKTIIGFGQLCERARVVCGKGSNSIIGDPDVGMATSIYAMSYFHFITKERFDYHKIFDQRINVNELDDVLASIIKKCWDKIYLFDNLHPRDKARTEACWKFVKSKVELNQTTLNKLNKYCVSKAEHEKRESAEDSEEDYYFTNLNQLLSKNGKLLFSILDIVEADNSFYRYRVTLKNTIKRIHSRSVVITLATLKELIKIKEELSEYKMNGVSDISPAIQVDFLRIRDKVFKSKSGFFEKLRETVESKTGDDFENHFSLMEEINELVEKFDLYPGLSIYDMERIEQILDSFNI